MNRLRDLIDRLRNPPKPDAVPIKPRWDEQVKAGISWAMISAFIAIAEFALWVFKKVRR